MPLTIVNIAYPIVPVGRNTVGGTEQIVALIDEGLVRQGHRSLVIASEDSQVAGTLIPTPAAKGTEPVDWDHAYYIHRATLRRVLAEYPVDIIHLHGIDFQKYISETKKSVLVTLHLPWFNYPKDIARPARPRTFVNCVSQYSRGNYDPTADMPVILGGIDLERFRPGSVKEDFVFTLGRIVPEKGYHLVLDAAKQAGLPVILAGKVPPFPEAQEYFEKEIKPRLDTQRRFIGPADLDQRVDLMARARCVVMPSLVQESGPLVAMEAQACGTPIIAHRIGALPEIISDKKTGFVIEIGDMPAMVRALQDAPSIDPATCRRFACERFSSERMVNQYLDLYRTIAENP